MLLEAVTSMKPESADEDRRAREEQVLEVLDGRRRRHGARASTSKRFNDAMLDGSGVSAFKAAFCANMSSPVHARKIGTQPGAVRRMRRRSVRGAARRTAEAHPRVIVRLVDVLDPERAPARASIMSYGPEGLKSKDTQVADASKPIAYRLTPEKHGDGDGDAPMLGASKPRHAPPRSPSASR